MPVSSNALPGIESGIESGIALAFKPAELLALTVANIVEMQLQAWEAVTGAGSGWRHANGT